MDVAAQQNVTPPMVRERALSRVATSYDAPEKNSLQKKNKRKKYIFSSTARSRNIGKMRAR
jgi:hypothetical protein